MDYPGILAQIEREIRPLLGQGRVADYIPPLAREDPGRFAMALRTISGEEFGAGEAAHRFSIQSVSKAFRLAVAMEVHGDDIWRRVGREPSGTAFNSLLQLEAERGIPRNPMINAGALVALDSVMHTGPDPGVAFIARCLGAPVSWDADVSEAERATSFRNLALANLLKSLGNLEHSPDKVVAAHCRESAVVMSCLELCRAASFLAAAGVNGLGERVCTPRQAKRINAVMLTCGVYDEAGDYAYRVGLPAKSGVGGGVMAIMPGQFSVAVWSPGLNPRGNSLVGTKALELLTTMTGVSVF